MIAIRLRGTPIIKFAVNLSLPVKIETIVVITEENGIIIATTVASTTFIALVRISQHIVEVINRITIFAKISRQSKLNIIFSIPTVSKIMAATNEMITSVNICIVRYSGACSLFAKAPVAAIFTP